MLNAPGQFHSFKKAAAYLILASVVFSNVFAANVFAQTATTKKASAVMLDKYTTDLTALAAADQIKTTSNFEREVTKLANSLASGSQTHPVVLDPVAKDELLVVEALAEKIASGREERLQGTRVLKLELDLLFDKSMSDDEIARAADGIFIEMRASSENTVLFVDELANFVGDKRISNGLTAAL